MLFTILGILTCSRSFGAGFAFEGDHFAGRIHDGRIGGYRTSDRILRIGHVDDNDLGDVTGFFADADVLVRFHGERVETDV